MEATFLHGLVAAELDDHEVGGAGERGRLHVLEAAGESGDVDGGLFSPSTSQDLDGVENLFRVELGELEEFAIRDLSNQSESVCHHISTCYAAPIFRSAGMFETRAYDVKG